MDHASLTRGNTALELVDASTFFVGESSRQSRRTHHVMDEEFIDDDDLIHTPTSDHSEKGESFEEDHFIRIILLG